MDASSQPEFFFFSQEWASALPLFFCQLVLASILPSNSPHSSMMPLQTTLYLKTTPPTKRKNEGKIASEWGGKREKQTKSRSSYIYIYMCIYIYVYTYIYTYIYTVFHFLFSPLFILKSNLISPTSRQATTKKKSSQQVKKLGVGWGGRVAWGWRQPQTKRQMIKKKKQNIK